MTPTEYLKKPYTFCLIWDEESQTWTGTVKEFPGCIAQGDSWSIVWKTRMATKDWIAAALDLGQEIPDAEGKVYSSIFPDGCICTWLGPNTRCPMHSKVSTNQCTQAQDRIKVLEQFIRDLGSTIPEEEVRI